MLVDIDRSILPHFDLIGGKYKLFVHSFIYLSMKICHSVFSDASKKKMLKNNCTFLRLLSNQNVLIFIRFLSYYRIIDRRR